MCNFSFTSEELEDVLDQAKLIVLKALVKEDLMCHDMADYWCMTHTPILRKKSFFRTISNLWKDDEVSSGLSLMIVKHVSKGDGSRARPILPNDLLSEEGVEAEKTNLDRHYKKEGKDD